MDLTGLFGALVRRWYVVALGMLLTLGVAYSAYSTVPPTFEVRGSVLLLPPERDQAEVRNPLLGLNGLDQPGTFVSAYLDTQEARDEFTRRFPGAQRVIGLDPQVSGPVMTATVNDPSAEQARAALDYLLTQVQESLASVQDDLKVPEEARVLSAFLGMDSQPTVLRRAQQRATILALGLGALATVAVTVALDGRLRHPRGAPHPPARPFPTPRAHVDAP